MPHSKQWGSEGLSSQRGIAWRCSDSLSLRDFLGIPLETKGESYRLQDAKRRRRRTA